MTCLHLHVALMQPWKVTACHARLTAYLIATNSSHHVKRTMKSMSRKSSSTFGLTLVTSDYNIRAIPQSTDTKSRGLKQRKFILLCLACLVQDHGQLHGCKWISREGSQHTFRSFSCHPSQPGDLAQALLLTEVHFVHL